MIDNKSNLGGMGTAPVMDSVIRDDCDFVVKWLVSEIELGSGI